MAAAIATTTSQGGFLSRETGSSLTRASTAGSCHRPRLPSTCASAWPMASACSGCRCRARSGATKAVACPPTSTLLDRALFTTSCDWRFDLGWMFTLFFVVLGLSAAIWGGWLERAGPRKAGVVAAFCWCGGLLISALGIYYPPALADVAGLRLIGGIGLGLGYISPVSTLIKWFPDRRGMATGMAIMGFGGGALIGSPLANHSDELTSRRRRASASGRPSSSLGVDLFRVHDGRRASAIACRRMAGGRRAGRRRPTRRTR